MTASILRGAERQCHYYPEELMTAKEKLLSEAPRWSEHDAEVALRAVARERAAQAGRNVDGWGDLDVFSARASASASRRLDEEEAAAGFSWDEYRRS